MILKLSLDLPEEAHYVRLTRLLGRTTLDYMRVTPSDVHDVETIIDELVANVIRHAHSEERRFLLTLDYYAKSIIITVKDTGRGFVLANISAKGTKRPDLGGGVRTGGYGLGLVSALTDKLEFKNLGGRGTTVKAVKHLTYQTAADADWAQCMNEGEATATVSQGDGKWLSPAVPRLVLAA